MPWIRPCDVCGTVNTSGVRECQSLACCAEVERRVTSTGNSRQPEQSQSKKNRVPSNRGEEGDTASGTGASVPGLSSRGPSVEIEAEEEHQVIATVYWHYCSSRAQVSCCDIVRRLTRKITIVAKVSVRVGHRVCQMGMEASLIVASSCGHKAPNHACLSIRAREPNKGWHGCPSVESAMRLESGAVGKMYDIVCLVGCKVFDVLNYEYCSKN